MFKLDDRQALIEPDFHDGKLWGIFVDQAKTLTLTCSDRLEREYAVRVAKIKYLIAENFRSGNIIFNLRLFQGDQCPRELVGKASEMDEPQFRVAFENLLQQVSEKNWTIVQVESSYGCELTALAMEPVSSVIVSPVK
jgi:hypothetical protein